MFAKNLVDVESRADFFSCLPTPNDVLAVVAFPELARFDKLPFPDANMPRCAQRDSVRNESMILIIDAENDSGNMLVVIRRLLKGDYIGLATDCVKD